MFGGLIGNGGKMDAIPGWEGCLCGQQHYLLMYDSKCADIDSAVAIARVRLRLGPG